MVSGLIVATCLFAATAFSMGISGKTSNRSIYYLIWKTDSVQAGSAVIEVQGGAGFATCDGVAIDVYLSLSDAEAAKSSLESYNNQIILRKCTLDDGVSNIVLTGLRHVKGWQDALQNGVKQSVVRAGLQEIAKTLAFYAKEAKDVQAGRIANELQALSAGIIYVQELRYFSCAAYERLLEVGEII